MNRHLSIAALLCALLFILPGVASADGYATTRYPIVMAHGFTGAERYLGLVDYWYGIPQRLRQHGNEQVYTPTLSAVAGEHIRVAQLEAHIERIAAATGAQKFNLIGHSQGTYTVRAYAALHPERVASLTVIGGPVRGSKTADAVWSLNTGVGSVLPAVRDAIVALVEYLGWLQGKTNGLDLEQEALSALYLSTRAGSLEFGRTVGTHGFSEDCNGPMATVASGTAMDASGNEVAWRFPIYSWVGRGAPTSVFRSGKDLLDPSSVALTLSYYASKINGEGDNDGVVPTCGARLGEVISDRYYWSHLDEVNQLFGLTPDVDPRTVFLAHANRLQQQGL